MKLKGIKRLKAKWQYDRDQERKRQCSETIENFRPHTQTVNSTLQKNDPPVTKSLCNDSGSQQEEVFENLGIDDCTINEDNVFCDRNVRDTTSDFRFAAAKASIAIGPSAAEVVNGVVCSSENPSNGNELDADAETALSEILEEPVSDQNNDAENIGKLCVTINCGVLA